MNNFVLIDKIVSISIVSIAYLLTTLFWLYYFNDFVAQNILLLLNFPYGIVVLTVLFFGNRAILGLLLTKISIYFFSLNYDFILPFKNYPIMSFIQLACMPITLYVLEKFNYTIGTGINYKLDKTNIYHVLLICFLTTFPNIILSFFYSLLIISQVNFLLFSVGCLFGSIVLTLSIKLLVHSIGLLKRLY